MAQPTSGFGNGYIPPSHVQPDGPSSQYNDMAEKIKAAQIAGNISLKGTPVSEPGAQVTFQVTVGANPNPNVNRSANGIMPQQQPVYYTPFTQPQPFGQLGSQVHFQVQRQPHNVAQQQQGGQLGSQVNVQVHQQQHDFGQQQQRPQLYAKPVFGQTPPPGHY